ncbi:MAG TPA: FAD-binding protein [Caulobacteraceae bacterium]|nr:FAD-binding protein [Caulobacteraceae bacterium]
MHGLLSPTTSDEARDAIADAAHSGATLDIRGGGSKAAIGAPRDATVLDMSAFNAMIDYDPAELVLTVGAGARLADIQALVAEHNQMLAFEPFDHGPILGGANAAATIGGVISAGVAGSRRLSRGSVRDHLLGFKGVSGRGEAFVGGAKVVKNVTGYDLPKIICGSWGRLVALTEVTLKVLPRPREQATLALSGLEVDKAIAVMARAMGSQAEVAAAAHIPAEASKRGALTLLRLEGFGPSVAARRGMLEALLADEGSVQALAPHDADALWSDLRTIAPLADAPVLWRINAAPSRAGAILAALPAERSRWLMDWAGGLIWLAFDGEPSVVRNLAQAAGGHAALVRAPEALRRSTPALQPQAPAVMALEARLRRAFDPAGVFETGRFLDAPDAD